MREDAPFGRPGWRATGSSWRAKSIFFVCRSSAKDCSRSKTKEARSSPSWLPLRREDASSTHAPAPGARRCIWARCSKEKDASPPSESAEEPRANWKSCAAGPTAPGCMTSRCSWSKRTSHRKLFPPTTSQRKARLSLPMKEPRRSLPQKVSRPAPPEKESPRSPRPRFVKSSKRRQWAFHPRRYVLSQHGLPRFRRGWARPTASSSTLPVLVWESCGEIPKPGIDSPRRRSGGSPGSKARFWTGSLHS